MRPIQIVMSAFGSYANKEIIEFTKSSQGLFLITGDTGAGKTTIFDAMSFALYDQTSGGKRDGSMMRSQYAKADTETFVEFTFAYEDKRYTVRRSPEYYRQGKRNYADGSPRFVKELPKVELILPDESVFIGKKKEIDRKIEDIIGLDKDQFTQIVMLAQGDFLKLLHAESKERKKIFSRIFQTKLYYKMGEELRERAKELYIHLEDNRKDLQRETQRIECPETSRHKVRLEELLSEKQCGYEEIEKLLFYIVEEGKEHEKYITSNVKKLRKTLDDITQVISGGEAANQLFEALEKEMLHRERLSAQEEQYKIWKQRQQTAKRAEKVLACEKNMLAAKEKALKLRTELNQLIEKALSERNNCKEKEQALTESKERKKEEEPKLEEALIKIKSFLPQYVEWNEMKENLQKIKKTAENHRKMLDKLQKTGENLLEEEKEIIKFREKHKESAVKEQKLQVFVEKKDEEIKKLRELKTAILHHEHETLIVMQARQVLEEQSRLCFTKGREYESLYSLFLKEQAGILARNLEEGEPCPVCGAVNHPAKAELSDAAPEEEEVKEAKRIRDEAEEQREIARENYQKLNTKQELEAQRIKEICGQLLNREPDAEVMQTLEVQLGTEQEACKNAKTEFAELTHIIRILEQNEERFAQIQVQKKEHMRETEEARNVWTASEDERKNQETRCRMIEEELPFKEEKTAQKQYEKIEKELTKIRETHGRLTEAYQKSIEKLRDLEGQQRALAKQEEKGEKETEKLTSAFQRELKKQKFESEAEYRDGLADTPELPILEKKILEYKRALDESKGTMRMLKEQTKGKKPVDLSGLLEEQDKSRRELKESEQLQMRIYALNRKNKEVYEDLNKHLDFQRVLRKDYECLNVLSRTANGSLSGSVKIDFETYVQRQYFKQIIHAANLRLGRMTNQEFILQCREMEQLGSQGQVGLDLDVYHLMNDTVRDVKTLSGGESFLAALSMALGLSDLIQNQTGAIHISTMFVDEGFGALDDEARERAIQVLMELAGEQRLVGIISHVNELKEQIDCKLIVTKDESGSHARWSV